MLEQVFRPQAAPYRDDQFQVTGSADATKLFKLEVDTQAAGKTLTLDVGAQTLSRTASFPVLTANDTLAFLGVANVFSALQSIDLGSGATGSSQGTHLRMMGTDAGSISAAAMTFGSTSGSSFVSQNIGGTRASQAATAASSAFWTFSARGHDGTSQTGTKASFSVQSDGLWTGANNGTVWIWSATPNGSVTLAEWMRITDACLLIGTTTKMTGVTGGLSLAGTTDSTSTTTGTLQCAGGIGFGVTKSLFGGGIKSTSGTLGIGYATGAGGTITQNTNKSTGVTLDKVTGTITMNNANLAAATSVGFTLTNSTIAATDTPIVVIKSGATADSYTVQVDAVAAGSCRISLRNYTAGALAEAVVLSFNILKGVAA